MPGRYATALFELAEAENALDKVNDDLGSFLELMEMSDDMTRLVRSPVFTAEEQGRAIAAVIEKAGISGLTANFLKLVAKNRRLFAVRDMIGAFRALLAQHRGEVSAQVTSADKLSDAQLKALTSQLKASIGRDVQVETRVDPGLLGGLVVKVGSRMVDTSLRTKLQSLKIAMKEVG